MEGKAEILVGDENIAVGPGSMVFVEAHLEHRFHTISEDLTVLVIFTPAEHTNKK